MNPRWLILVLGLTCAAVAQDPPRREIREITIEAEPTGEVEQGGRIFGKTPIRIPHSEKDTVRIAYPDFRTPGAQVKMITGSIPTSNEGVVRIQFTPVVQLRSVPSNAAVFLGDSLLGRTPLLHPLSSTHETLRIQKPGFRTVLVPVDLDSSDPDLILLEATAPDSSGAEVIRHFPGWSLPSPDILIPATIGVAAGIAAVWFKQEADRRHDRYLAGGNPEDRDKTRHYDLYSGISLGLVQMVTAYFLFRLFHEN